MYYLYFRVILLFFYFRERQHFFTYSVSVAPPPRNLICRPPNEISFHTPVFDPSSVSPEVNHRVLSITLQRRPTTSRKTENEVAKHKRILLLKPPLSWFSFLPERNLSSSRCPLNNPFSRAPVEPFQG